MEPNYTFEEFKKSLNSSNLSKLLNESYTERESRVLLYILSHGGITSRQAADDIGVLSLASCIKRLRNKGWDIQTEMHVSRNRFSESCSYARYIINKNGGTQL